MFLEDLLGTTTLVSLRDLFATGGFHLVSSVLLRFR